MASRDLGDLSAILGVGDPVAWDDVGGEELLEDNLTAEQLAILTRVSKGQGLFRLLDDNLNPVYDFGPSEPVAVEVIEGLLKAQAIQFRGVLGFRLPLRAHLTAWGQELLEGRL
jgi:hypothetical protein